VQYDRGVFARSLRWLRAVLPRLYFTRFPLLFGALTIGIVPVALAGIPTMLASMFVLTPFGIAVVTLFATASAFTVMATRRIVLVNGAARFGGDWHDVDSAVHVRDLAIYAMVALPIVTAAVWRSIEYGGIGWGRALLGAVAGTISAVGLILGAVLLNAWLADNTQPLPDLVVPGMDVTRRLHGQKRGQSIVGKLVNRVVGVLRPYLGPGYLDEHGRPLQAHLFASALLLVFLVVYAAGYFAWMPGTARAAGVPALVYLLTIGILANWFLAGVAFYLDRYHLPTLLPLMAWTLLIWGISRSDHYFELRDRPRDAPALALPAQVAAARAEPLLTVIASDGGGAQAAGWAATVLTGIQERWPGFQGSTRLISAVSGGSVGTMYFVASLREERSSTPSSRREVRDLTVRGSLSEAAWGLAYPDLWRVLMWIPPWFHFEKDRAWAMEQAWTRDWNDPSLSAMRVGVNEGWRPSIALNATGVETGERFAFATFAVPQDPQSPWNTGTLQSLYADRDIALATAARVSATFPYVTPISRASPTSTPERALHFGDGGYADNTGMALAMRWLDAAMTARSAAYRGKAVAFIQIRSAPDKSETEPKDRGWLYELIGPLQTLLNVRVAGQRERAESELRFLQRLWCGKEVEIRRFTFAFERQKPPLSWQLTPTEVGALETEWASARNRQTLDDFLALAANPVEACAAHGITLTSEPDVTRP
jgi:hypothetical protein